MARLEELTTRELAKDMLPQRRGFQAKA